MFRSLVLALAVLLATLAPAAAEVGDDGLHKEAWFTITFRDIAEEFTG